jgi:hypothetical protein
MGGWLASAMAAAKLAPGDMPARRPVPAGSLSPQGSRSRRMASSTTTRRGRSLSRSTSTGSQPADQNRLFARPRRIVPAWDATNS